MFFIFSICPSSLACPKFPFKNISKSLLYLSNGIIYTAASESNIYTFFFSFCIKLSTSIILSCNVDEIGMLEKCFNIDLSVCEYKYISFIDSNINNPTKDIVIIFIKCSINIDNLIFFNSCIFLQT